MLTSTILIATYKRSSYLKECLEALNLQEEKPTEVIVVVRVSDYETLDFLEQYKSPIKEKIRVVMVSKPGIVAAENRGLSESKGEVVILLDDDAIPQEGWLHKILRHYQQPDVGTVAGPAIPYIEGVPMREYTKKRCLQKTWYGRHIGNSERIPDHLQEVHVLRGCNMSFRSKLVSHFDENLKPYWRRFEDDAILQVRQKGFRVLYDPDIQVFHHTAPIQEGVSREESYESIWGSHHNNTYVLLKHLEGWSKGVFLGFTFMIGDSANMGVLGYLLKGVYKRDLRRFGKEMYWALLGKVSGIQSYRVYLKKK